MTSVLPVSPLLDRAGAVAAEGRDAGVAWHYGDPMLEQRALESAAAWVDRSNRGIVAVPGVDRLSWLHSITSQHLSALADGDATEGLVLSPHGHVEHHFQLAEVDGTAWLDVEPGTTADLLAYLNSMRFLLRVEPRDASAEFAVLTLAGPQAAQVLTAAGLSVPEPGHAAALPADPPASGDPAGNGDPLGSDPAGSGGPAGSGDPARGGGPAGSGGPAADGDPAGFVRGRGGEVDLVVPRAELAAYAERLTQAGASPAGLWAYEAVRVAGRRPRLGAETDHRTIPHEVGWIGTAVHLDKGCYRGQETVARVHNLGRPPRRLVLLHLSGERDDLPPAGTPLLLDGRAVGFLGTAAHHHELGPIALAVVKRTVPTGTVLDAAGTPAAIDPGSA